jgi:hypothetical protein
MLFGYLAGLDIARRTAPAPMEMQPTALAASHGGA